MLFAPTITKTIHLCPADDVFRGHGSSVIECDSDWYWEPFEPRERRERRSHWRPGHSLFRRYLVSPPLAFTPFSPSIKLTIKRSDRLIHSGLLPNQPHDPRGQTRTQTRARSRTHGFVPFLGRSPPPPRTRTFCDEARYPHSSRLSFQSSIAPDSTAREMQSFMHVSYRSGVHPRDHGHFVLRLGSDGCCC